MNMIRKLFLPLFLILALAAQAQVNFGVHVGLGLTTTTTPEVLKNFDMSYKYKFGPMVGVTSTIEVCDFMSLQPELNVSWRGYKDEIGIDDAEHMVDLKINSIYGELPLMFKFYPSTSCGFNLQVGPQLGVLIHRKTSFSDMEDIQGDLVTENNHTVDFGLNFGVGYSFGRWDLDLRYYLGLVKTYTTIDHCKNRGFQLMLGYNF